MRVSVIGLRGFPEIEGGVEKHCESLYPRLNDNIKVTVYRRKPYLIVDKKYKNIDFKDLPSTKIKGFEPFVHSMLCSIDAMFRKPDVVHYHNIGPALFSPIVKIRKIPVVLTYHSANYEHRKWGRFAKALLRFSEKIALKTADRVVFVNKFQMEKYDEVIRKKSIYIPNGINDLQKVDSNELLKKYKLETGKYILSVGRITPEKGFDVLIKAFNKLPSNEYKLVIAGGVEFEDSYMEELRKLDQTDNVIFTGYTRGAELTQLYENAKLFVLASRNEGFPLVLLEAMRFGLDVLVSDIPATHLVDLSLDDYFKAEDDKKLLEGLENKLRCSVKRQYDLETFNWDNIAKEVENLYFQLKGKE